LQGEHRQVQAVPSFLAASDPTVADLAIPQSILDEQPRSGQYRRMPNCQEENSQALPELSEQDLARLGRRIVHRRRARGWNQRELARRASIMSSRLSRLERGKVEPKLSEIVRLHAVLGGTLDELVFAPKPPSTAPLSDLLRDLEQSATAEELDSLRTTFSLLARGLRCEPTE
jgi:transcriptional regulator with XRE-family HTH domain